MEPDELAQLVVETGRAWQSLGQVRYGVQGAEKNSLQFRRSLYVVEDVCAGERLSAANVRAIRPGMGLSPKHFDQVVGRKVRNAVHRGTPISWDLLD
jgi:N-acetylneuraminate synthase